MNVAPILATLALIAPQDEAKAVGTLWRIGNPGLYVSAPTNLKAAPVDWAKAAMSWVADSADIKVEVAAADLSQIEALTKAAGDLAGGGPREVTVSGYRAARWGSAGNQSLLIAAPRRLWVISAKGKEENVRRTIETIMLDRSEPAQWMDRNLGATSLQSSLPYEGARLLEDKDNATTHEIAWDGVRLLATEFRGSVDYAKTLELQTADLKSQGATAIEQTAFAAGFLNGKGTKLTTTIDKGSRKERAHRVLVSVGTRVALIALSLDPASPKHLAIERRILDTLRVGWTVFDDFKPQSIDAENMAFEAPITLNSSTESDMLRLYGAGGWLLYSLQTKGQVPNWPQEGKDLNAIVGQIVTGAGGTWKGGQDRLTGFGPFLGTFATGQGQGQRGTVFTSAASTFTSSRGYLWVYMTETVSFDVMQHVADSVRFNFPLPNGWARQFLGPVALGLPEGTKREGEAAKWRAERDGIRVSVDIADLPASGDATALIPAGGFRARTHLAKGFGWVQQGPINEGAYRLADTLVLIVGDRVAKIQVAWTPTNPASGLARDGVLASISTP